MKNLKKISAILISTIFILQAAETIEAYIPFTSKADAAALKSALPDMTLSSESRLSRMNYFVSSSNSGGGLRVNPPYAKANRSRAFQLSHPVKKHRHSAADVDWADDSIVNRFTVKEFAELVPHQNTTITTPNPRTKIADWSWSVENPHVITDVKSKESFPNAEFPENETGFGITPFGEVATVKFWYDSSYATTSYNTYSAPGAKADIDIFNGRYYFSAVADNFKHSWMEMVLPRLGKAYLASGNEIYATYIRAALFEYARNYRFVLGARESNATGRMGSYVYNPLLDHIGSSMKLIQRLFRDSGYNLYLNQINEFTEIYDMVYRSELLNDLVPGDGKTYRDFIEESFFIPMVDLAWDSRPTKEEAIGNIADYAFQTMELNLVIGKDDWNSLAQEYITLNMTEGNGASDGLSMEGPGYHENTMVNIYNATQLTGYQLGNNSMFDYRFSHNYLNAMTNTSVFRYPNGILAPIHDNGNHYVDSAKSSQVGMVSRMVNRIAPGFGHTLLGSGEGENRIHAFLHWSGGGSHTQRDNLSLGLFFNNRELYGDPGYNWDTYARKIYGHNTLFIDGRDGNSSYGDIGDNCFFSPNTPGVTINRISHGSTYRTDIPNFERYRRTLVLNTTEADKPYLIDLFEASGGSQHELFLQGTMMHEMVCTTNVDNLAPWQNVSNYLSGVANLEIGRIGSNKSFKMFYKDAPSDGVKVFLAADESDSIDFIHGDGPVYIKDINGHSGGPVTGKVTPKIILRRTGKSNETLRTLFLTVHEPYANNTTNIQSVSKQVITEAGKPVQLGITVTFKDGRNDYHLLSLAGDNSVTIDDQRSMNYGPLTANGSYASAVTWGGNCDLYLVAGTSASCLSKTLSSPKAYESGSILEFVRRNDSDLPSYIVSDIKLPIGNRLDREMIYVDFLNDDGTVDFVNSYEIKEVKADLQGVKIIIHQNAAIEFDNGVFEEKMPAQSNRAGSKLRLRYMTAKSTVPVAYISPNQGLWENQRATDILPIYTDSIVVSSQHLNGSVQYSIDKGTFSSLKSSHLIPPSTITDTVTVVTAQAGNSGGVMVSPKVTQAFRNTLSSKDVLGTVPGLMCSFSNGDNIITPDVRAPELGYSPNRRYRYNGYITIPEEGIYQFRYFTEDGYLAIDSTEILNSIGLNKVIPWKGGVTLAAGQHDFQMDLTWRSDNKNSLRNVGDFVLQWKRPGDSLFTVVPQSVFTHLPTSSLPSITLSSEQDTSNSALYCFAVSTSDDGSGRSIEQSSIGWDVNGDGRTDFFGSDTLTHLFPEPGEYTVFLVGFNTAGERAVDSANIVVSDDATSVINNGNSYPSLEFKVGPNPVLRGSDGINIKLPSQLRGECTISIYDALGNKIEYQKSSLTGENSFKWDLKNRSGIAVASGIYLLHIKLHHPDGDITFLSSMIGVKQE